MIAKAGEAPNNRGGTTEEISQQGMDDLTRIKACTSSQHRDCGLFTQPLIHLPADFSASCAFSCYSLCFYWKRGMIYASSAFNTHTNFFT